MDDQCSEIPANMVCGSLGERSAEHHKLVFSDAKDGYLAQYVELILQTQM